MQNTYLELLKDAAYCVAWLHVKRGDPVCLDKELHRALLSLAICTILWTCLMLPSFTDADQEASCCFLLYCCLCSACATKKLESCTAVIVAQDSHDTVQACTAWSML
jgi:hypothetical protein